MLHIKLRKCNNHIVIYQIFFFMRCNLSCLFSTWCPANNLSLLHEVAEGQGAPETLLHAGRKNTQHPVTILHTRFTVLIFMFVIIQNIDTLERVAGFEGGDLIEAHGTFYTSHCVSFSCRKEYNLDWMKGVLCLC